MIQNSYVHTDHTVSDGFIIGMSAVGMFLIVVFIINMVAIGGIKFRKYCTNVKFKLTKSKKYVSHNIIIYHR